VISKWLIPEWKLIVAILILFLGAIYFSSLNRQRTSGTFLPIKANISAFGHDISRPGPSKADRVVVVALATDGEVGRKSVPIAMVRGCRIGDPVNADSNGHMVRIYPRPCRK
tara:strand:- start:1 stop:336 length:336 start_codon:yes stop_codon:yes gene_type:complete